MRWPWTMGHLRCSSKKSQGVEPTELYKMQKPTVHDLSTPSTGEALPIAPSMAPLLQAAHLASRPALVDKRTVAMSAIAVILACATAIIAQILIWLIAFFTNLAFYARV